MTSRNEIMEQLKVRFPESKVTVKKATVRAGAGIAYIATIKNDQVSAKDVPKIMILSFDSSGKEIQNAEI